MELPLSRASVPRLEFVTTTGSTNDDLRAAATGPEAAEWPHGSVIVTDDQTHGRGRLGRTWLAPTGKTLAISVLLRPEGPGGTPLPLEAYGWIPLIAGAAMTEAVRGEVERAALQLRGDEDDGTGGIRVELKWPNDVLVAGYKVCGILSELLPPTAPAGAPSGSGMDASAAPGAGVVVGAGLNLTLDEHDLPTLTSTSLLLATGVRPDADAVLAAYLTRLLALVGTLAEHGGDAASSGIAERVAALCGTLGSAVHVRLPADQELVGTAERLDGDGRLVVRDRNGEAQTVSAGDITHLRYG
ncbi:biotin--[acetyl-CoA-carboxylase] ligase [Agromyces sp. Marseille-P2726]|uniref:biotin--[acetyl-CoA-carboxylase] ligase n=1 Tax=Agromyces sp. Marseille-P2726 TaxID=2709132 RepID=UPI001571259A|nr:biotin--[acetyl-CoA-carboxylase] ligase [Agromyces sp. Marseille-P2726]